MLEKIKQFFVRFLLKIIKIFVFLKPKVSLVGKVFLKPFVFFLSLALDLIVIPLYRSTYGVRKQFNKVYNPAHNKLMLFITNRYAVHIVMAAVVVLAVGMNIGASEVRAENFGSKSLMYQLVTNQDQILIEDTLDDVEILDREISYYRPTTGLVGIIHENTVTVVEDQIQLALGEEDLEEVVDVAENTVEPVENTPEEVIEVVEEIPTVRTSKETYVVQSGDTISTIAAKFDVSIDTILWANDLSLKSVLQLGDELTILPVTGIEHKVVSGDTLLALADTYDAEISEIQSYNSISNGQLSIGDILIIPGGEKPKTTSTTQIVTTTTPAASTTTSPSNTTTIQPTNTAPTSSGAMAWPTDLRTITQYYGWSHTGLDIDCYYDNDNYAADNGVVTYSGWRNGYGYTVEIDHGGGMMTRYAHHAELYVSAGDTVVKGQAVGLCGTTGRSTGTHIHFEVIVNGQFKNPLEYIR